MGIVHAPRHGSLQFWPRCRAERIYPKISAWYGTGLQGFAAYKVGMTQYVLNETRKNVNFGKEVVKAATVLEVPPIYPVSINFYKKDAAGRKRKIATLFDVKTFLKSLKRTLKGFLITKMKPVEKSLKVLMKSRFRSPLSQGKLSLRKHQRFLSLAQLIIWKKQKPF